MAPRLGWMYPHDGVTLYIAPSFLLRRCLFSSWYQVTGLAPCVEPPLIRDGHVNPLVRSCQMSSLCVTMGFLLCN